MPNQPTRLGIAGGLGGALVDAAEQWEVSRDYHEEKSRRRKREDVMDKYQARVVQHHIATLNADDATAAEELLDLGSPDLDPFNVLSEAIDANGNGIPGESAPLAGRGGYESGAGGYFPEEIDGRKGGPRINPNASLAAPGALSGGPTLKDTNATRKPFAPGVRVPPPATAPKPTKDKSVVTDLQKKQDAMKPSPIMAGDPETLAREESSLRADYTGFQRKAQAFVLNVAKKYSGGQPVDSYDVAMGIIRGSEEARAEVAAFNRSLIQNPRFASVQARFEKLADSKRNARAFALGQEVVNAWSTQNPAAIADMLGANPGDVKPSNDPARPGWVFRGQNFGQHTILVMSLAQRGLVPWETLQDALKVEADNFAKIQAGRDANQTRVIVGAGNDRPPESIVVFERWLELVETNRRNNNLLTTLTAQYNSLPESDPRRAQIGSNIDELRGVIDRDTRAADFLMNNRTVTGKMEGFDRKDLENRRKAHDAVIAALDAEVVNTVRTAFSFGRTNPKTGSPEPISSGHILVISPDDLISLYRQFKARGAYYAPDGTVDYSPGERVAQRFRDEFFAKLRTVGHKNTKLAFRTADGSLKEFTINEYASLLNAKLKGSSGSGSGSSRNPD